VSSAIFCARLQNSSAVMRAAALVSSLPPLAQAYNNVPPPVASNVPTAARCRNSRRDRLLGVVIDPALSRSVRSRRCKSFTIAA
jgi:hypothetical protein